MIRRLAVTATTVTALALLGACGGGEDQGSAGAADAGSSETTSDGDACAELKDAGYTGADFGTLATWEPVDRVQARVESLAPLQEIAAPEEVAQEWATRADYLQRLQTLIEEDSSGTLPVPESHASDEETAAGKALTDWWFDTCQ